MYEQYTLLIHQYVLVIHQCILMNKVSNLIIEGGAISPGFLEYSLELKVKKGEF